MKREFIIDGTKKGQTLPVDNLVVMQVLAAQQDLEIDVKGFDLIFSEIWETSALMEQNRPDEQNILIQAP